MNVHKFDGALKNSTVKSAQYKDLRIEEKITICQKISSYLSQRSLTILNVLIKDIGTNKNIDNTNGLNADDLLCSCTLYLENKDFISLLSEQLIDMETGLCPQGRTHRLYQLLLCFE